METTKERISHDFLFAFIAIVYLIAFYFVIRPITAHAQESEVFEYIIQASYNRYDESTERYYSEYRIIYSPYKLVAYSDSNERLLHLMALKYCSGMYSEYYDSSSESLPCEPVLYSKDNNFSVNGIDDKGSIITFIKDSDFNFYTGFYTNIPLFQNYEQARNYLESGDTSGQINKPEYVDNENFVLSGFECNNSIFATWKDIICPEPINKNDVIVYVKPTYFLILESGEEEQNFTGADTVAIQGDYFFSKPYDDYFIDNPYKGRCQLFLTFTPTYNDTVNNKIYRGKQITVSFSENGTIQNIDIPESALVPTYTNDFSFKNFTSTSEFHNFGDSFIHCYWTGVDISESINYIYSDIKVQIYARTGEGTNISYSWIDYDLNDIVSFSSNRLDFNLTELDSFCRERGYRFYDSTYQWSNEKIRITPYCKTSNSYLYGKSVEINLTKLGGIDSILQSQGDAINDETIGYDNLEDDYFTDHSVIGDLVDNVVNGDNSELDLNSLTINFFSMLNSFFKACGQFPSMLATVFFFLPDYYVYMLTIALSLIIILRILGR